MLHFDMTWEELTGLLSGLAEEHENKAHVVRRDGMDTIALHFVPVAWFVSMRFTGTLNMGIYQGEENRLVGTEQIPLAELTPAFVRERVEKAAAEQFTLSLDPEAVDEFLEGFPRPRLRDVEGAGGEVD